MISNNSLLCVCVCVNYRMCASRSVISSAALLLHSIRERVKMLIDRLVVVMGNSLSRADVFPHRQKKPQKLQGREKLKEIIIFFSKMGKFFKRIERRGLDRY